MATDFAASCDECGPCDRGRSRVFGNEFVEGLRTAAIGGWHGPVRSDFGVHLVELSKRQNGGRATLNDVRADVERDLLHARTEDAKAAVYKKTARELQRAHR